MLDMQTIHQQILEYLHTADVRNIPIIGARTFDVCLLARGEYNLNYLLTSTSDAVKLVFRVNIGTQIEREDQILYEYHAPQTPGTEWSDAHRILCG